MKIALLFLSHRPSHVLSKFLGLAEVHKNYAAFLHHDFSQSDVTDEILNHPSLSVLENYYVTQWAHVSVVEATVALLHYAFEKSFEFEWFILLSGSCYPICSLTQIFEFLESTKYDGFIEHTQLDPTVNWLHQAYYKHVFTHFLMHIPFLSRRGSFYWREIRKRRRSTPFSNDFQLYFGSQWWVLRRKVVGNLICHYKLQELLKYARNEHIHASEEWIIQSIVGNLGVGKLQAVLCRYWHFLVPEVVN